MPVPTTTVCESFRRFPPLSFTVDDYQWNESMTKSWQIRVDGARFFRWPSHIRIEIKKFSYEKRVVQRASCFECAMYLPICLRHISALASVNKNKRGASIQCTDIAGGKTEREKLLRDSIVAVVRVHLTRKERKIYMYKKKKRKYIELEGLGVSVRQPSCPILEHCIDGWSFSLSLSLCLCRYPDQSALCATRRLLQQSADKLSATRTCRKAKSRFNSVQVPLSKNAGRAALSTKSFQNEKRRPEILERRGKNGLFVF